MSTPKKPTVKKPKALTEKKANKTPKNSATNSSKSTSPVRVESDLLGFGVPEDTDYMDTVSYDLAYLMTHLLSAVSPKINQGVTFDLLYGMFAHEEGIDEHIAVETGLLIGASHTVPASRETH